MLAQNMDFTFFLSSQFRKHSLLQRIQVLQNTLIEQYPTQKTMLMRAYNMLIQNNEPNKLANSMVESAIGTYPMPLGLIHNLNIDGVITHIPIATEEPSVVMGATYAAKIFSHASNNGILTRVAAPIQIAQIALLDVTEHGEHALRNILPSIHTKIMSFLLSMHKRGGGIRNIEYRRLPSGLLVVHIHIDVQDAMGANIANSVAEYIAPTLQQVSQGTVLASILSNYSDTRVVHAQVTLDIQSLPRTQYTVHTTAEKIEQMSLWAEEDIYRATTHNKGIMNGVNGFAIATGNDTRALEAATHALAATHCASILHPFEDTAALFNKIHTHTSQYQPLSIWRYNREHETLHGSITLPAVLASIGGSTSHPIAQWTKAILGINSPKPIQAHIINRVAAALGLAQNFAALHALVTQGIHTRHIALHARKKL